jgi:hypothetical protein
MNNQQVADLLTALQGLTNAQNTVLAAAPAAAGAAGGAGAHQGGYRKIPNFESADPFEWTSWRRSFAIASQANQWDDLRQRRECAASMMGAAQRAVQEIVYEPPVVAGQPPFTIDTLLGLYQDRFQPAALGRLSRVNFASAKQTETEQVLAWHGRLRALFIRAFPAAEPAADANLIDKFVLGLFDPRILEYVWQQDAQTFQQALTLAHDKQAGISALQQHAAVQGAAGGLRTIKKESGINAFQQNQQRPRACWICNGEGHISPACPQKGTPMGVAKLKAKYEQIKKARQARQPKKMASMTMEDTAQVEPEQASGNQ